MRKNFQREGRFDPEEGEFEFSLSAEKVKQKRNMKHQNVNVGNKLLQLSKSVDKIKVENSTNHEDEPKPRMSIIPYTNNTIPSSSSRMSSEKSNTSNSLKISNNATIAPKSTKEKKIWENFIPGYNNISTEFDIGHETKIMSITTEATIIDNKVAKTIKVQEYNIKDHMNDSSRFVGFQKSIASNSSMKNMDRSKMADGRQEKIGNNTLPKSFQNQIFDLLRTPNAKNVNSSSSYRNETKDIKMTTYYPAISSSTHKNDTYKDISQSKNSTMLAIKRKELELL